MITATSDPYAATFRTHDSGIAQFLIFNGRRARCHADADGTLTFTFVDSAKLRAEVEAYTHGASVPAIAYAEAGRVTRRLIMSARYNRQHDHRESANAERVEAGTPRIERAISEALDGLRR